MNNWKYQPADKRLAKYIYCYWYLNKKSHDTQLRFPRLIPNPMAHLVVTLPDQTFSYKAGQSQHTVFGSHLLMPCQHFIEMDHRESFTILGITFQPGIVYSGFRLKPEQMNNHIFSHPQKVVPFIDVHKLEGLSGLGSGSLEEKARMLDQIFLPLLDHIHEDNHVRLVQKVLGAFRDQSLAELEQEFNCSRRTLERSFLKVTGFTLKQYQALVRLDKLIRYLYKHRDQSQDWADIALQFGFSDQPHLIRELKKSIGETPGRYANSRNLSIDAYGDFE